MKPGSADVVVRNEVRVMYLRTSMAADKIRDAWDRMERLVGTRGRKFYGALDQPTAEYWVCVEMKDHDDASALGLETAVLPGGKYLRARLRGEPARIYQEIGPTFVALEKITTPDATRPEIEAYRQRDEIDLLVPVLD